MRGCASLPIRASPTSGRRGAVSASRAAYRAAADAGERPGTARLPPPDRSVCCPCDVRREAAARYSNCPGGRLVGPLSCLRSLEGLRDMDKLDGDVVALGAAALVHEAGAVGRDDVIGLGLRKVMDLVRA